MGFDHAWLRTEVQALHRYGSWHGDVPMRRKGRRFVFMVADVELIRHADGDQIVAVLSPRV